MANEDTMILSFSLETKPWLTSTWNLQCKGVIIYAEYEGLMEVDGIKGATMVDVC